MPDDPRIRPATENNIPNPESESKTEEAAGNKENTNGTTEKESPSRKHPKQEKSNESRHVSSSDGPSKVQPDKGKTQNTSHNGNNTAFESPAREIQFVPESNCNSNTRRKVQHWIREQCTTPASIEGPESVCTKITSQSSESNVSTQSSQQELNPVEIVAKEKDENINSDSESVLEVIRTKKRGAAKKLPDTESDHLSQSHKELAKSPGGQLHVQFSIENNDAQNDNDAVEVQCEMSGPANQILGPKRVDSSDEESVIGVRLNALSRRRIESSQSTASTHVQHGVKSPPKVYDNPDDVPRVIKKPLFKSKLLQKPPPVTVKPIPSSAENGDPYAFKCSQKTPEVKDSNRKKARTRGKGKQEKGARGKRKRDNSSDGSDWDENDKITKKGNTKSNKQKKISGEREDGIKRLNTYGKEPDVILFDTIQEQNTAPFSSPSDIVQNEGETPKPQKRERPRRKAAQQTQKQKLMEEKTSEQIERLSEYISQAEDFDLVFSQQVRDEAEEYRKKLKKKTKDNPRTNRVSFDNKMTVCNQEGETQIVNFEGEKEIGNGENIAEDEKLTVEILIEGVDTELITDQVGCTTFEQDNGAVKSTDNPDTTQEMSEQINIEKNIEDPEEGTEEGIEDEVNLLEEEPSVSEQDKNVMITSPATSTKDKESTEGTPNKTLSKRKRLTRHSNDSTKSTGSDALNASGLKPKTHPPKDKETPSKKGNGLFDIMLWAYQMKFYKYYLCVKLLKRSHAKLLFNQGIFFPAYRQISAHFTQIFLPP